MNIDEVPPLTEAERHHIALYRRDKERKELLNRISELETELKETKRALEGQTGMNAALRSTVRFLQHDSRRMTDQIREYRTHMDLKATVDDLIARIKSM